VKLTAPWKKEIIIVKQLDNTAAVFQKEHNMKMRTHAEDQKSILKK
jgi:hypothetical protein